jgi:nucleoside-diphosphate-sugar epimerase
VKALVLGGSVFVGRHLVDLLVQQGHAVTVLNRGRTPAVLPDGVCRLVADRTDLVSVRAALASAEWDVVFDVSGFVMVAGGGDIEGLLDLFEGRAGRYVYVSSIMAYDQNLLGVVPWTEDMASNPSGSATYGGFKASVEAALMRRWHQHGFPSTVVRPGAIYGPDNNIYDMETPMWLRLIQRRPIVVPHSGLVTVSYGHVDDLCAALLALVACKAAVGEVFNVSGEAVTATRYVETLADIAGVDPIVVMIGDSDLDALDPRPFGHLFGRAHHAVLASDKARRLAGVEPRRSFEVGHEDTYRWFRAQGLDRRESPLSDPLWNASWDFAWEKEVAENLGRPALRPPGPAAAAHRRFDLEEQAHPAL